MPGMTDKPKKPRRKPGRPQGRTPSVTIFARINPELAKVLQAYIDGVKPKTTTTAVVELALERYLTEVGHWPPPADKSAE
jgi:hypothetical protein